MKRLLIPVLCTALLASCSVIQGGGTSLTISPDLPRVETGTEETPAIPDDGDGGSWGTGQTPGMGTSTGGDTGTGTGTSSGDGTSGTNQSTASRWTNTEYDVYIYIGALYGGQKKVISKSVKYTGDSVITANSFILDGLPLDQEITLYCFVGQFVPNEYYPLDSSYAAMQTLTLSGSQDVTLTVQKMDATSGENKQLLADCAAFFGLKTS